MKRKYIVVALIALTVIGSLFMMLSSNMFFGDILNASAGDMPGSFFVTLPAITVTMFFVVALFYLLRTYKNPEHKKRITFTYSIILMALGLLGILGAVLGGAVYYKSFIKPNPFPGYLIIFLVLNIVLTGGGVFCFLRSLKMEKEESKMKITF
ncbi:MAG: hypothetical protein K5694_01090, partial [Bacilli bacterium]|nr:hypothetical protein [Bacilli bacterium]